MITNYNPMFGSKEQCEDLVRQIKENTKRKEENGNMNNKLLFYVDTNRTNEGNEYTVSKLHLESGDTRGQNLIKERTSLGFSERLHQLILKEKPFQVIFERAGIAAATKDSYIQHLEQHPGKVLMDQTGKLYYNVV
ncbi:MULTISPECIES: hypothetical protein [Paenibacillus]|uniref:hypothetical protein n=1 Tax=Paenibacillus TaxID=44249 RepID=UPI0011CDC886|nr:hypothetical protein [Paenibacillus xylanexedens]